MQEQKVAHEPLGEFVTDVELRREKREDAIRGQKSEKIIYGRTCVSARAL